jgi:NTP pyrophosphatase (non-canonical NTP hydrolase)
MNDLLSLQQALLQFRDERNWKQFHTLKNLIVSLNLEAAELLELTQWKSDAELDQHKQEPQFRQGLEEECADVLLYLLLIAENGGIDLLAAAKRKIEKNAERYPVELSYGSARKYTEFGKD